MGWGNIVSYLEDDAWHLSNQRRITRESDYYRLPDAPNIQAGEQYPHTISKTYDIRVITPIFGGGVETGFNDPITLIRPSSIRGHLRFWWRATRGARFKSVPELRQREGEIWGTTDNPSPVSLEVRITKQGVPAPCAIYEPNPKKRGGKGGYDLKWQRPFDDRGNDA